MDANLDHQIDLNSDALPVEHEIQFNLSQRVSVSDNETLMDLVFENVVIDPHSHGVTALCGDGLQGTIQSPSRGFDIDKGSERKENDIDRYVEPQTCKQGEGLVRVDEGTELGYVGFGTDAQMEDVSVDKQPKIDEPMGSDGVQKQATEIDELDRLVESGVISLRIPDAGEDFNLIVDLNACKVADDSRSSVQKLAASKDDEFGVSDLVWGKVSGHPWWPGQIFDPSAASKKAKKHFKKNSYLIAYFGDKTFAWNDAAKIKPFRPHFSQMEGQMSMDSFCDAVDCALDEVARRVQLGLACRCLPEEAYSRVKTQTLVNAGIQEELSRRDGGDNFSSVDSFEPALLAGQVRTLASSPFTQFNRLEFITAEAQVTAFYSWKGYFKLQEFEMLGGLLESEEETSLVGQVRNGEADMEPSCTQGANRQKGAFYKRKRIPDDNTGPAKNRKKLSNLSKIKSEHGSETKTVKMKPCDTLSQHSAVELKPKRTFRVGDSILRVANRLNGSTPKFDLKNNSDYVSPKKVMSIKGNEEALLGKSWSLHDILSQLCLAAQYPTDDFSLLSSGVSFLLEFRNSVSLECIKLDEYATECGASKDSVDCEMPELEDSYWPDKIAEDDGLPPENPNNADEALLMIPIVKGSSEIEPQAATSENPDLEDDLGEDIPGLILNFSDFDSVPSEEKLNTIFSRFGPLWESETQVLKKSNRAKVVFKRRNDAETAFSSAGKYSIFGPSLISYRLKFFKSRTGKVCASAKRRKEKGSTCVLKNST